MSNEDERVVVTDRRRINAEGDELLEVEEVEEVHEVFEAEEVPEQTPATPTPDYLEDLQRVTAEYANFRRRKEAEVLSASTLGQARLVADLLGVLDDVERARSHAPGGELEPGFRSVADGLEKALTGAGLERFGAKGDPFDPAHHEALSHLQSPEVQVDTVVEVYRAGYTFAGRVLRPAQVVVAGPATDATPV